MVHPSSRGQQGRQAIVIHVRQFYAVIPLPATTSQPLLASVLRLDKGGDPMTRRITHFALAIIAATVWLLSASGQSARAQAEWISAVRQGGHVIVFRHGATHNDQADTDPLHLEN